MKAPDIIAIKEKTSLIEKVVRDMNGMFKRIGNKKAIDVDQYLQLKRHLKNNLIRS